VRATTDRQAWRAVAKIARPPAWDGRDDGIPHEVYMRRSLSEKELEAREALAYRLITAPTAGSFLTLSDEELAESTHGLSIPFPSGLAPTPQPRSPAPKPSDPLPKADFAVVTYTDAEAMALADVMTPGVKSVDWYAYARAFESYYRPLIGSRGPSLQSGRLGSYYLTSVAGRSVLVFKSELHMNTDWKQLPDGQVTLPVKDLYKQMIAEVAPQVFLTTGTSGGVSCKMHLGDVVVTRAARFHCRRPFKDAPFHDAAYRSEWTVPIGRRQAAHKLMQAFAGRLSGSSTPPSSHCGCSPPGFPTQIVLDGEGGIPEFHPTITADYFEFGTSTNGLDQLGTDVETDDAVLGLAVSELKAPPHWACIRNLSDPAINGDLPPAQQTKCAVFYYQKYGYWTTVMSALTVWCVIASST